jgi:hypothetical protein
MREERAGVLCRGRRRTISGLILVLLLSALASIFTQTALWPICPYSMFSERGKRGEWDAFKLFFVYENREVALPQERGLLHRDFDAVSVLRVLRSLVSRHGVHSPQVGRYLALLLEEGPLQDRDRGADGIRLYRVFYRHEDPSSGVPVELRRELKREVVRGAHD